jgi:hypothetical protein
MRVEGLSQLDDPVTSSEIETETFRLAAYLSLLVRVLDCVNKVARYNHVR